MPPTSPKTTSKTFLLSKNEKLSSQFHDSDRVLFVNAPYFFYGMPTKNQARNTSATVPAWAEEGIYSNSYVLFLWHV